MSKHTFIDFFEEPEARRQISKLTGKTIWEGDILDANFLLRAIQHFIDQGGIATKIFDGAPHVRAFPVWGCHEAWCKRAIWIVWKVDENFQVRRHEIDGTSKKLGWIQ